MAIECAPNHQDVNGRPTASTPGRSPLAHYFERVENVDSLSPDDFLDRFERYGFLWFKANGSKRWDAAQKKTMPTGNQILDFVKERSSACEASWTIENHSNDATIRASSTSPPKITPQKLHDFTGSSTSFYVSTIVHRKPQERQPEPNDCSDNDYDNKSHKLSSENHLPSSNASPAHQSLMEMLPKFDNVFEDIYENGDPSGTWLFLGHHGVSAAPASTKSITSGKKKLKKRKLCHDKIYNDATTTPTTLIGRAEHVDEVTHSGTYHIQIAGTKTWKIRPHPDSFLGDELMIDSNDGGLLRELPGAEQEASGGKRDDTDCNKNCWRLKINVEEGDVFVLNTKIWYHCTELNFTPNSKSSLSSEWSISVAQDFYLPVPCPKDVKTGDVVYGEYDDETDEENNESNKDRAAQEIPDELPRSDNPNCVLVEIDGSECDDDSDDDDDMSARTKIMLVALRDIVEGESLTIAFNPQEDQLGNANEQIDPRVISRQYWNKNQIVLQGENRMPQDVPRSYEPNCELVEINGGDLALRALVDIPDGGVFCILPDDDEEYEEVEVDLGTGELVQ